MNEENNTLKSFIITYIDCDNKRKIMTAVWNKNASCKEFKRYLEKNLDIIKVINVYSST